MKISCPNCPAAYELDEGRIPPAGLSIKCPKCKVPFVVHKAKPGESSATSKIAGAVPLPGAASSSSSSASGAKKIASSPNTPAVKPRPSDPGAGPLPGVTGAAEPSGQAVPLPGIRSSTPSQPMRAVPAAQSSPQPPPSIPASPPDPQSAALSPLGGSVFPEGAAQQREPAVPLPGQSSQGPGASADAVPLPGQGGAGSAALHSEPAAKPKVKAEQSDPFADIEVNLGGDSPSDSMTEHAPISLSQEMLQPPPEPAAGPALVADFDDPFPMEQPPAPKVPQSPPPAVLPDDGGISFDFVEAPSHSALHAQPPPPPPPSMPPGSPELLDFVDEPKAPKARPTRPPPPMMGRSSEGAKETAFDGGALELDATASARGGAPESDDPKKAAKDRKQRERLEKAAHDREERERRLAERKAQAGPPLSERLAPLLRESGEKLKKPAVAASAAVAVAAALLLIFGIRARRTPAGLFWMNQLIPSKKEANATEAKVIEQGMERLADGSFAGAREAAGMAARLVGSLPDDEEVKSFYVLCASELKVNYHQTGGDWDQAKRVVERIKASGTAQQRARGAYALGMGDLPKAKTILQPLGDKPGADVESAYLFSKALIQSGEAVHAAQVLDNALKTKAADSTKLLLLRGQVARSKGELPEAAGFFEQALKKSPDSGRALIELADVKLRQANLDAASGLLDKAVAPDIRKSLDATEEGRASMLRGKLFALKHQGKEAELAFDRAATLDPASAEVREASGNFRLARREYEKAAKQFDGALAAGSTAPGVLAGAARAYLGVNRLLEADKRINEAVAKDAANADYIYLQGKVAEAIGKNDEASKDYERALAKKPDLVEALTAQGTQLLGRGDKAAAQARLEAAMKVTDTSRSSLDEEGIGELALALGRPEDARDAYARALALDPEDPQAHAGKGKTFAVMNDLPAARKELELGLAELDSDASLFFEYGSLLRRMGDAEGALSSLQKAVKLDGKEPRYRSRLGAILVEKGEFDKGEEQLRQATLMNDKYGEAQYFLARALAGQKKLSEAVDVMKRAVELEPDNGEYLYRLGTIYEDGQQIQDAIEAFQRSITKNEKSPDTYEHLGKALTVENRFQEAVGSFKKAATLDPRRARLWAEVGDSEQQAGDVDAAIEHFQKAVSQDANLPGVWSKLGIAYKDKGCADCKRKALDALKRAELLDPNDIVAHHQLGYMYKDDGHRLEAIAEFKKYLQLAPTSGDAETVKDDIYYLQEESRRAP